MHLLPSLFTNPPGRPGIKPRWTTSAKSGVGTAIGRDSRVWFTISHGILDEVYYPSVDRATTRDFGLIVTSSDQFFSEVKRDCVHEIQPLAQGVPGYRLINTCQQNRYRITNTVITDPTRDVVLQRVKFEALEGKLSDYTLYGLVNPHLGNEATDNDGWCGDFRGIPILFAQHKDTVLAVASSAGWAARSCGYVGKSDGWQDLKTHFKLTRQYDKAKGGNIALTGAIDLAACGGEVILALAYGRTASEAGQHARASLLCRFEDLSDSYIDAWLKYQKKNRPLHTEEKGGFDLYQVSTAVLKTHESKRFPGALIASLSLPWGMAKGDGDLGGYHVVWPRDQVEAAGALLATDQADAARQTLFYLMCTQDADGHWPQNMWLDGKLYWPGIQADETAFPILLADCLRRRSALNGLEVWPTVRKAIQFLIKGGPVTPQDRWEENSGYSVFTLATDIAAILAAADFADEASEPTIAHYLRETADCWNSQIEQWTYVEHTDLARKVGVDGYYIRIAPEDLLNHDSPGDCTVKIKNLPGGSIEFPAPEIVSVDALALVRFGLRSADDPRILNTVKVIDATLKTETSTGPVWHRYTHDGYGEDAQGDPFESHGVGRGWPLFAGERAHYEIAAGRLDEARRLLKVMGCQTSPGGMIPEQIWESPDIPSKDLFNGHPSGSGMPLVWAHAEYLKLTRSLEDGAVFDTPPQPVQRYIKQKTDSPFMIWRFNHQIRKLKRGKLLRVETHVPARMRWSSNEWKTVEESFTHDIGLDIHVVDLPVQELLSGGTIRFTFYWLEADKWEGKDFCILIL